MSSSDGGGEIMTAGEAAQYAASLLRAAGIEDSRREARLLLGAALHVDGAISITRPETKLTETQFKSYDSMVKRRARREPVSRILGQRDFWTLTFQLNAATLDPRPDSETLIDAILASVPDRANVNHVLDLGTGSGCLLLSLLSELPQALGLGVDLNIDAARAARHNAELNGLERRSAFMVGDWANALNRRWDIVVSNPPYIPHADIQELEPEVAQWDPMLALDGGSDGLECVRTLASDLPRLLSPNGIAAIEIGQGQAAAASEIFVKNGLSIRDIRRDLGGIERCLLIELS